MQAVAERRALTGNGDAPMRFGLCVCGRSEVSEDLAHASPARGGRESQRRDDEIAERMVEISGEVVEHVAERLAGEPLRHSLDLGAYCNGRRCGGGDQDSLDASRGAHRVAQHLGPQRDGLGACLVAFTVGATGHRSNRPSGNGGTDRSDGPACQDQHEQTSTSGCNHTVAFEQGLARRPVPLGVGRAPGAMTRPPARVPRR
ncbi:MAG: hypothetical protein IPG46_20535 [Actinobacteria bacterium]|nr:hypothetical protein [Actinomycetota bacterium]